MSVNSISSGSNFSSASTPSELLDQIPEEIVSVIGSYIASPKEYRSFLEQFPQIKEFRSLERAEQLYGVFSKYRSNDVAFDPSKPHLPSEVDNHVLRTILEYSDSVTSKNPVICIGEEEWNELGIHPGVVPPIPYEELTKPCPFWEGQIVAQTHLLVLIPDIALNEFLEILKNKTGIKPGFIWSKILEEDVKKEVPAHWILIPKDVIPNSRSKTYDEQKAMLDGFPGYKMPRVRDVVITCLMEHLRTGKKLFGQDPLTFTRCEEEIEHCRLVVGFFAPAPGGLRVDYSRVMRHLSHGLACLREFF